MSFRLVKESAVVVGTFNIYIIQPAWLKEVGLVGDEVSGLMLETDLSQPGFKIILPPDVEWRVEPTRLTLESESGQHDFGATLTTILDRLPWTPLLAMGFNAEYEAERGELKNAIERWPHPATNLTLEDGGTVASLGWGAAIQDGHQRYNLSVYSRGDKFRFSSNVHTDLGGKKVDFAKTAAGRYQCCQRRAAAFAAHLYQVMSDDI